ncbi:MAG: membrane dipeptidase [Deltaproteobacteria bacterium]|nr:membrane dipeptidase [Deltaproteobacteria bacterium]
MTAATTMTLTAPDDLATARRLGVSDAAMALARDADIVDLHVDTFIPPRLWGYDPLVRHGRGVLRGHFFGQLDLPRMEEGGLSGAMWSITTNPFRSASSRWRVFLRNLERFQALVARSEGRLRLCRNHTEYLAARAEGAHACLLAIQGGNCLVAAPEGPASIPGDLVTRVTLVHLTNSVYGTTSSPLALWRRGRGLSPEGKALVEQLDAQRIFVDLAHINPEGFRDAVAVHDPTLPLLATHTGVAGVRPHWRNLDDDQLRAIARTGGAVGVIFSAPFLTRRGGPRDAEMVVEHLAHIVDVAGEDTASLGSDYDGAITPPPDLRDGLAWPRLVQRMLDRGWSEARIRKILGGNALRALAALRP